MNATPASPHDLPRRQSAPPDQAGPPPVARDAPWLAPMAGFSDLPFRLLCREYGCAAAVTEMVSAKGLVYDSKGTFRLLDSAPDDAPLVVQLFGSEVSFLEKAVGLCLDRGFRTFDLNAGCPVPKVAKTGAGASLLLRPERLVELTAAMVRLAGEGRVGVKLRLGPAPGQTVCHELGPRLRDAGAAWLALHPRFASQGYAGRADAAALPLFRKAARLPVLASGDLFTAEAALRRIEAGGADGVMFARGALYDPTIFTRYRRLLAGDAAGAAVPATGAGLARVISRHAELAREHANGRSSLLKMRTAVPRYLREVPGARLLRVRLCRCSSWEELEDVIGEVAGLDLSRPVAPAE